MNRQAVIVDAVRTPVGRSSADRGIYRSTRAEDLAVTCIHAILDRQPSDPHEISDIYLGCVQQTREHIGQFGLANAGVAFYQNRFAQFEQKEDHGGQLFFNDVAQTVKTGHEGSNIFDGCFHSSC